MKETYEFTSGELTVEFPQRSAVAFPVGVIYRKGDGTETYVWLSYWKADRLARMLLGTIECSPIEHEVTGRVEVYHDTPLIKLNLQERGRVEKVTISMTQRRAAEIALTLLGH